LVIIIITTEGADSPCSIKSDSDLACATEGADSPCSVNGNFDLACTTLENGFVSQSTGAVPLLN